METGMAIAAAAELWIDTPIVAQASLRGVGCDCKGLVAGVARDCARPESDTVEALAGDYEMRGYQQRLLRGLPHLFDPAPLLRQAQDERELGLLPGDVLLLWLRGSPCHLAILAPSAAEPLRVIEALPRIRKVRPFVVTLGEIHSAWRWRSLRQAQDEREQSDG